MAEKKDLNIVDDSNTARFPEGQASSSVNNGARALEGIIAREFGDMNGSLTSAGTADVITLAANATLTAYAVGDSYSFKVGTTNTAGVTLNVDSVGAKAIQKLGAALVAGDLTAGDIVTVRYDGTQFQLMTPVRTPVMTLANPTNFTVGSTTTVTGILDEDAMGSDSATDLATQQSIKAYVDAGDAGTVTSAAEAAASAAAALVSENNAATSEGNAATSETNAGTSEANAAASEAAAAASAATIPNFDTLTGEAGNYGRVKAGETDVEWRTGAETLGDIGGIGAATTDTLTNKTFDANGTGNSLSNVDVADLANGTAGQILTWDAGGAPTTVGAGTAAQVLTSNGAGAAPTFQDAAAPAGETAKGWVAYDQTGTPAILDSFNVTSVSDDGTGLFTVTWETDFASTSYAVVNDGFVTAGTYIWSVTTAVAVGTVSVQCGRHSDNGVLDCDIASVVAFGAQ